MAAVNDSQRSYAAAHFALELDGLSDQQATVRSIEGGGVKLDVMTYQQGGIYDRWRQLGKPKFDDIKVQVAATSSNPMYTWLQSFFTGNPDRRNGAIVAADFYYNERARREFKQGLITELSFPKLDATDKNAAYLTVNIAVEDIQYKPGSGSKLTVSLPSSQNLWTCCNFLFELEGYPTHNVSKIDSFTIKHTVVEYQSGGRLSSTKSPSAIEFPNLSFYVPESDSQAYANYVTNQGNIAYMDQGDRNSPLTGRLVALDNQGRELFYVTFMGCDIFGITPDSSNASSEEIKQVKVDLYTEQMAFVYTGLNSPMPDQDNS
jgi:phage tail-like protein